MKRRPFVVAGNGPSLASIETGRILNDDFIIRVNNFFFEPRFYLGQRVDLAFMGGGPQVAPFMFETLYQCRDDYDLQSWTSHDPRVIRSGQRRFSALYQPMRFRDDAIKKQVHALSAQYDRYPTSGTFAVLMAHAMGPEEIILAGFDLYAEPQRYHYELGPHYRALMGEDLARRGVDGHMHDPMLDLEILQAIQARGDVQLLRAADAPILNDLMNLAPIRGAQPIDLPRQIPPTDWASHAGLYPIGVLKTLRRGRALMKRLKEEILNADDS